MKIMKSFIKWGVRKYIAPNSTALSLRPEGIVCTSIPGNAANPALGGLTVTTMNDWEDEDDE